jgi:hypothetical protein
MSQGLAALAPPHRGGEEDRKMMGSEERRSLIFRGLRGQVANRRNDVFKCVETEKSLPF